MKVVPKLGLAVPDPERGGYLPEAGRDVPRTPYWLSRQRDGDVTPPPAEAAASAPAKTSKAKVS